MSDVYQQAADILNITRPEAKRRLWPLMYGRPASALKGTMTTEEISDRLEFLEAQCHHGPWKRAIDSSAPETYERPTLRCIACGAPIDHQHDFEKYPEDLVP